MSSRQTETHEQKVIPEDDPRVQMAAERTVLAWIRTGLALMAFGFVIARFALVLQTLGLTTSPFLNMKATIIGVLLVSLGVLTTAVAPSHYRQYFRRVNESDHRFAASSMVVFVAYAAALIGVALAAYLLFVDFSAVVSPKFEQTAG
jgi:putative membrane protein